MTPERHQRIMRVFNAAVALADGERAAYLDETCAGDAELRADVDSLLAHDEPAAKCLDAPILGVGFNVSQFVDVDPALKTDLPDRIGRYEVLDYLGAGSMGVVYGAKHDATSQVVALKVIRPDRVSPTLLQRFQTEMESLGRLHHPGIAQIFDAGAADTDSGAQPYIAMEFVDGRPLHAYVEQRRPTSREKLELLAQVCDAVEHAHQQGVIHRDLKPANILVETHADKVRPRILDFGVARLISRETQVVSTATQHGQAQRRARVRLRRQNPAIQVDRIDVVHGVILLAGARQAALQDSDDAGVLEAGGEFHLSPKTVSG